jgi:hypothetical protein
MKASCPGRRRLGVFVPTFVHFGNTSGFRRPKPIYDSTLGATLGWFECQPVIDGSPDDTARLVAEHFPMVMLIRQENQGCGMARNSGAMATSGELWEENQVAVSSALVRRSPFNQANGFWGRRACEDYHLWLEDIATRYCVRQERTRRRVAAACRKHARRALHLRATRTGAALPVAVAALQENDEEVSELIIASAPRCVFDLRRPLVSGVRAGA